MESTTCNHFPFSLGHDTIVDLLIQNGASNDINLQVTDPASDGDTSLHAAAFSGNLRIEHKKTVQMQYRVISNSELSD